MATTMEAAEASPLEVSPRAGSCRRSRPWSRSSSIGHSGSIEYTSLCDVLEEECGGGGDHHPWRGGSGGGGGSAEYSCHDIHDFDPSNIGIRNQLLKHAASAYLQSAVVVAAGRDEECCLARLWRRVGFGGAGAGLGCVDDPAAFVARSARRLAAFVAGRVGAVWPSCRWNSSPRAEPVAYNYDPADY
ncbi:uncharacterized protein LOC111256782 [Setaria italica]|uniref:uncharacterized protein LOC111256782 n=1 Tax=Setaria italica TaxID=4555 RepID=UPI000BE57AD7|nr:uncharacterized protein LOC111256782 [Setaria italica]